MTGPLSPEGLGGSGGLRYQGLLAAACAPGKAPPVKRLVALNLELDVNDGTEETKEDKKMRRRRPWQQNRPRMLVAVN